jgi:hypothetical protein
MAFNVAPSPAKTLCSINKAAGQLRTRSATGLRMSHPGCATVTTHTIRRNKKEGSIVCGDIRELKIAIPSSGEEQVARA